MEKVAKVFIIIAMVASVILLLFGMFSPETVATILNMDTGTSRVICIVKAALTLIVGAKALTRINDIDKPSIAMSVVTLILCSLLGGIFMLLIPEPSPSNMAKSATGASSYTNLQCTKCGNHDASVKYYTVNTALGKMNRPYCPECKAKLDQENLNK